MQRDKRTGTQGPRQEVKAVKGPSEDPTLREDDLERLAQLLGPLASPVRLRILRYLTTPKYLEEIASHLGFSRQAVRKHIDRLLAIGVVEKVPGVRDRGPVTDYVVNPQALFVIQSRVEKLGSLKPKEEMDAVSRTMVRSGARVPNTGLSGPTMFIVHGMDVGRRFVFGPGSDSWVVGRNSSSEIPLLHDPWVSQRHAEVFKENGGFGLTDLRSTNSTQHNWRTLPTGGHVELQHGDVIGVGQTLLLFWDR